MNSDPDLTLLSDVQTTLTNSPHASQRDIAQAINMSLGMTNNILKRFTEKGWLYMNKVSARNIQYVLTPTGLTELAKRGYKYVKRTIRNVYDYKECITNRIILERNSGIDTVILLGYEDVAFIIEYACQKNGLKFINYQNIEDCKEWKKTNLYLFAENFDKTLLNDKNIAIKTIDVIDMLIKDN